MMETTPYIPLSILRDLRCRQCENFVNCGPVHILPDGALLCGRCENLARNIYHDTSYEALASMFLYPCRNWENHCSRSLQWDESFKHEEYCSYQGCCNLFWKHPKAYYNGKRDIPLGDIRLTAIKEYLLEYIKCTQCESYLSCEPVYIQTNGGNICHRCVHANGIPPNTVRNVPYEILANIIIFPCVFRNRGCPTRLKFGTDLWHHESQCSYNQMFKKATPKILNQKEKGVIRTHSGHYYGTITPYTAPFSPPSPTADFEINRQLVQSLKKQQERRFLRAEEIGTNISKMSSEDGSVVDLDFVKGEKSSSSEASTPTGFDGSDNKQKPTNNSNQQSNLSQRESGYSSNIPTRNNSGNNSGNYYQNINLAQTHQETRSSQVSRSNSYNQQMKPAAFLPRSEKESVFVYPARHDYQKRTHTPTSDFVDTNGVTRNSSFQVKKPFQNIDYDLLAGHYPVFGVYQNNDSLYRGNGLIPKPSVTKSDSLSSNKELMEELRQKMIKKAIQRKEMENPYKECNNLEEIIQIHEMIRE